MNIDCRTVELWKDFASETHEERRRTDRIEGMQQRHTIPTTTTERGNDMTKSKQSAKGQVTDSPAPRPAKKEEGKSEAKPDKLLGFLAVSATAAIRMAAFPIVPGFDESGPFKDLKTRLAMQDDWEGYAVLIDGGDGSLQVQPVDLD